MLSGRLFAVASLTLGVGQALLTACASDDRPGSLVISGAESGRSGSSGGRAGASSTAAGQNNGDSGSAGEDTAAIGDAGAAGEANVAGAPIAIFPEELQVDVACGASPEPAVLVIHNGGILPLTISSARTTAGYEVKSELPLEIEAMASATLEVTPLAPSASAAVGDMTSGKLTFVTNEPGAPSHEVVLQSTLFGAQLAFADGNGAPLGAALPLTYLSSGTCPDNVRYRVRNTGNLAFMLFGPSFPLHLGGTSTGAGGQNVPPNEFVELEVGGNSATDGACSGGGDLSFTVQGSFCGPVPKLSVSWPANTQTSGCACVAATE